MEIDIQPLISHLRAYPLNTLYPLDFEKSNSTALVDIPNTLTWKNIVACPLEKRTYSNEPTFSLIVAKPSGTALIPRTLTDMAGEHFGIKESTRPFIAFPSHLESMEKGFWFYEHGVLPLIACNPPKLALIHAEKYQSDAFLGSNETARLFMNELPLSIKYAHIIDEIYDPSVFNSFRERGIRTSFTLALPETGSLGNLCQDSATGEKLIFHTTPGTYLELGNRTIVTKLSSLASPVLRYETSIVTKNCSPACLCAFSQSFTLL